MTPSLSPRKYKIEQDYNEHVYYVSFLHFLNKWAITFENGRDLMYMYGKGLFTSYEPKEEAVFDAPEEALNAFDEWYKPEIDKEQLDKYDDLFQKMIDFSVKYNTLGLHGDKKRH